MFSVDYSFRVSVNNCKSVGRTAQQEDGQSYSFDRLVGNLHATSLTGFLACCVIPQRVGMTQASARALSR